MNLIQQALMDKPSLLPGRCVACGDPTVEKHHIVPRGQGGAKGPQAHVCGFGNTSGHHGMAHAGRLHFRWGQGWEILETDTPTKMQDALDMDGWRRARA